MKIMFACVLMLLFTNYGHSTIITDKDIQDIYTQFVKPNHTQEYKQRYMPLPLQRDNTSWRWEGKDFPRVIAVLEFERFVNEHGITSSKALAINGEFDPEWHYLTTKQKFAIDYETDNHDLHTLELDQTDFDFVMVNQTLEHVYDPIRCLQNINKHMCSGGILYLNVPANSILHSVPFHHYTGYTPVGLGAVVKAAGFKILSIGYWGNWEYLKKMHESYSWPDYRQLKDTSNDVDRPVIAWIFAMKV